MSYITLADIQQEFAIRDIPTDENNAIDTDRVNRAIDRAQATADGYLRSSGCQNNKQATIRDRLE